MEKEIRDLIIRCALEAEEHDDYDFLYDDFQNELKNYGSTEGPIMIALSKEFDMRYSAITMEDLERFINKYESTLIKLVMRVKKALMKSLDDILLARVNS